LIEITYDGLHVLIMCGICRQTPITHIISTCEPSYVI